MKSAVSTSIPILGFCLLISQPVALATVSSIGSNFNGTNIADTSTIWFNSHLTSVSGATGPLSLYFTNQAITFTSPESGISYTIAVPDSQFNIDPTVGAPSTAFTSSQWITTAANDSGTPFLSGIGWDVPTGENPKASNPVSWTGDFTSSQAGVSLSWQWSAAVYSQFSTDNNALGVTPVDGFHGISQSGTPENYRDFVVGGARGGGGSNFTGSNSGTASVNPSLVVPEPGSLLLIGSVGMLFFMRRRRRNA